jgi:hypothetical protein
LLSAAVAASAAATAVCSHSALLQLPTDRRHTCDSWRPSLLLLLLLLLVKKILLLWG